MKKIVKLFLIAMLIGIMLTACAPKPPEITKDQFENAQMEADKAEAEVKELKAKKAELQEELQRKEKELRSLKAYQKELQAETGE